MRSFRAKPVGWKGESHRHYLAAKGIKSRYDAGKTKAVAKFLFGDGKPETENFDSSMKMVAVDNLRNEVVGRLNKAEEDGEITFENSRRFMNDDFTTETKDFLDNTVDKDTYVANVKRKLGGHLKTYGSHFSVL